jgi:hypothetical protein
MLGEFCHGDIFPVRTAGQSSQTQQIFYFVVDLPHQFIFKMTNLLCHTLFIYGA